MRLLGDRDGIEAATEIWQRFAIRSLFVSANLDEAARAKAAAQIQSASWKSPLRRAASWPR